MGSWYTGAEQMVQKQGSRVEDNSDLVIITADDRIVHSTVWWSARLAFISLPTNKTTKNRTLLQDNNSVSAN